MIEHPIKIAHLTYDMRIGGTEQVILNIIQGQFSQAVEHHVICLQAPLGPFANQLQKQGITIHSFNWGGGFDFDLVKSLRNLIVQAKFNILHCHQYTPWSYGALSAIGLETRVIFTEHGRFHPDIASPKRRWINPLLMHFTERVTAISAATKQALVDFEYLSPKHIEVIYNGIVPTNKSNLPCPFEKNTETVVFGTIARFDPIKNHILIIKAFAEYQKVQPNSLLVLVGDGETALELKSLTQSLNITSKVLFTGYQLNTEAYLQHFDVFLLTSFSEGTSMTLLNAMQFKKSSIVTNVGGNPEIIKHEYSGLVINNDDKEQLVESMHVLTNPEVSKKFGENAFTSFHKRFTAKHMIETYDDIYISLCPVKTPLLQDMS